MVMLRNFVKIKKVICNAQLLELSSMEKSMPEKQNQLVEKIKGFAASNGGEHFLNILKAGLSTAPFCGGIASLLSDYIPSTRFTRLESFVEQIAEDLNRLQGQVNSDLIATDEYAHLFENCLRGVAQNYQNEKLQMFRGIIINSLITESAHEEERLYYLSLVNNLSTLHIRILKFMENPRLYLEESEIAEDQITGGFSNFFPIAIPNVNLQIIIAAFSDLYDYGLINTSKDIFHTMTSGQGLRLLGDRVSDFGKNFIQFCTVCY